MFPDGFSPLGSSPRITRSGCKKWKSLAPTLGALSRSLQGDGLSLCTLTTPAATLTEHSRVQPLLFPSPSRLWKLPILLSHTVTWWGKKEVSPDISAGLALTTHYFCLLLWRKANGEDVLKNHGLRISRCQHHHLSLVCGLGKDAPWTPYQ